MIVTASKPYGLIRAELKKGEKIGIVSCNSCPKKCETGGQEAMDELAARLRKDGFEVVDTDLIGAACDYSQLQGKEMKGDVTVMLACDAGVNNLKKLLPKRKVVLALETLGLGAWDKGDIKLVKKFEK